MTLESELKRKKESLKFFYQMAQEALDADDLEQAIEISARGLEEAELKNQDEWAEKFEELNSQVESAKEASSLNTTIVREDITVIRGVGKAVAEKLKGGGFHSVKMIAEAAITQLTNIPGIGLKTAEKISEGANELISRKNLNDFPEESDREKTQPIDEIPRGEENDFQENDLEENNIGNPELVRNSTIVESDVDKIDQKNTPKTSFPWFEKRSKVNRAGASQKAKLKSDNEVVYEEVVDDLTSDSEYDIENGDVEDEDTIGIEDNIGENPSQENSVKQETINIIDKTQGVFRETSDQKNSSSQLTQKITPQSQEQLLPSEKKKTVENVIHALRESGFYIIEKVRLLKDLSMNCDLIALKIIHTNEFLDLVLILPIRLSMLKGEIKISNKQLKYIPSNETNNENGSSFRMQLNSTINDLGEVYSAMRDDIISEGKLLSYLRKQLKVDISIEKSMTKKNLFFRAGPLQYKIFIEPLLVCNNNVGFLEKVLPFPYLKDINLHMINSPQLAPFLTYLEEKFTLLEEHSNHKNSLISYEDSFNQFLQTGKKLSVPFIAFGITLLMLVLFQIVTLLELVVNIGYALLGVYSTSLVYFYIKFFKTKLEIQTEFGIPHHQKKVEIDDPGLIIISEAFSADLMEQFVFECLGKNPDSSFIQKIEEAHIKERLDNKAKAIEIKNENLFEKQDELTGEEGLEYNKEKTEIQLEEEDEIFQKYGSFLED